MSSYITDAEPARQEGTQTCHKSSKPDSLAVTSTPLSLPMILIAAVSGDLNVNGRLDGGRERKRPCWKAGRLRGSAGTFAETRPDRWKDIGAFQGSASPTNQPICGSAETSEGIAGVLYGARLVERVAAGLPLGSPLRPQGRKSGVDHVFPLLLGPSLSWHAAEVAGARC
ncbi:hypothetical protein AAFF_G00352760 [Aldrovandia affinis]|uniref:Uncharacterized protein n=1 Tax=Aldrovandia affinis TaxID=143900 RepID=A0AAD7SJ01_9TELE|nr:hypothetical protein AAFF_G00352760 [Aldrovandia affinis]